MSQGRAKKSSKGMRRDTTVGVTIRIPKELDEKIKQAVASSGRSDISRNTLINAALQEKYGVRTLSH